ncbi:unnamed protein product [Spirodela intermedia]|uniref:RING-type E3 ubiquitin transferase n=1 Tax=Spirodela intermedia TaxID=51605 RepID=A0A7I8KSJ7_SPIIN|nr:unnamed protein product [Spirodela intermedia]
MPGGETAHWCYQCRQTFRLRHGRELVCPRCHGGFVQELDDMEGRGSPLSFIGYHSGQEDEPRLGMVDAISAMMSNLMGTTRGSSRGRAEQGMGLGPPPWLWFQGQLPSRFPPGGGGGIEVVFPGDGVGFGLRRGNVENYFVGPGVDELLFERLGRGSDQRGPPPAPRAAIDALPTVKIKQRHLRGDSACPVCKDKFELGAGARELPCKHLYHSDCIVPWLQLHNSCPVCRQELPSSSSPAAAADRGGGGEPHGRRNPLSFLWPFRAAAPSSNSRYHRSESGGGSIVPGVHDQINHISYSDRPFD